jgi:hypothetical protein
MLPLGAFCCEGTLLSLLEAAAAGAWGCPAPLVPMLAMTLLMYDMMRLLLTVVEAPYTAAADHMPLSTYCPLLLSLLLLLLLLQQLPGTPAGGLLPGWS